MRLACRPSLYIGDTTLRVSQVLSFAVAMLFLAALVFMLIKTKKNPKPIEGVDFFPEPTPKKVKTKGATTKDMRTLAKKRANKNTQAEEKQEK